MKRGAGKSKGSGYERWVAKELSKWLTNPRNDDRQLVRSVLSGGWEAGSYRHLGDLAPNGVYGDAFRKLFVVECKHHAQVDLYHYWNSMDGGKLAQWWRKLVEEAGSVPGLPMNPLLVFRQNRRRDMVGVHVQLMDALKRHKEAAEHARQIPWMVLERLDLAVVPFDDILDCDPRWLVPELPR